MRCVESAGVDFISVHGRLKSQRSSTPPNLDAIALIKSTVRCPVVANGDVYSFQDIKKVVTSTNVDGIIPPKGVIEVGVMAARGILENPGLYAGYDVTPWGCVERYVNYALSFGSNSHIFHHHLTEMTAKIFTKRGSPFDKSSDLELRELNDLKSIVQVVDWLDERFVLKREGEDGYGDTVSIKDARRTIT